MHMCVRSALIPTWQSDRHVGGLSLRTSALVSGPLKQTVLSSAGPGTLPLATKAAPGTPSLRFST